MKTMALCSGLLAMAACSGGDGGREDVDATDAVSDTTGPGDVDGVDTAPTDTVPTDSAGPDVDTPVDVVDAATDAGDTATDTADTADTIGEIIEVGPRAIIDERGGTLAITDPASPVFGAALAIPAGALSEATLMTLREAALPVGIDHMVAARGLELLPADTYFRAPATLLVPLADGLQPGAMHAKRWSGSYWETNVTTLGGGYRDPAGALGGFVLVEAPHFSSYWVMHEALVELRFDNATGPPASTIEVTLAAVDFDEAAIGFVPPPPPSMSETLDPGWNKTWLVYPGRYVLVARYEGDEIARCLFADARPGDGAWVWFRDETAACARPEVALEASSTTLEAGDSVDLVVRATSPTANPLSVWFTATHGGVSSVQPTGEGAWTASYRAPQRAGRAWVYATVYDEVTGVFGEATLEITVTSPNRPPTITSFTASPRKLGPGTPGVFAVEGAPGTSRLTASAADPDGDPLTASWFFPTPGDLHDIGTGIALARGDDGLAVWPDTKEPYTATEALYKAPVDPSFFGTLPLGFMLVVTANVSDGALTRSAWLVLDVEPEGSPVADEVEAVEVVEVVEVVEPGPDVEVVDTSTPEVEVVDTGVPDGDVVIPAGSAGMCQTDSYTCIQFSGDVYHQNDSGARATCAAWSAAFVADAACPSAGALGACTYYLGQINEWTIVQYPDPDDPNAATRAKDDCIQSGIGTWSGP